MTTIQKKAEYLSSPFLILFAFAFPLGTSAGSISAIPVLLAVILTRNYKKKLLKILHNPVAIIVLFYIALHVVGLLWSEDVVWGLHVLRKQRMLLLFPIFLTIARKELSNYYMAAFVSTIVLKASQVYLVWMGLITPALLSIFEGQIVRGRLQKDVLTPLRRAFPIFFLVIMPVELYLQVHRSGLLFSLFRSFLYKDFSGSKQIANDFGLFPPRLSSFCSAQKKDA